MVLFEGTYNSRDIGGLPLVRGGTTASGVLIRSDDLAGLTSTGLAQLAASDVGTIVDFRTPFEQKRRPNRVPEDASITQHQLAIAAGQQPTSAAIKSGNSDLSPEQMNEIIKGIPTLGNLYIEMLTENGTQFAQFINLLANPAARSGLLVHCAIGKDRTGVSTALALSVAGVEPEAIVENYHETQANIAQGWTEQQRARLAEYGITDLPEPVIEIMERSPKWAIEQALAYVTDQGGVNGYLQKQGVTDATLRTVRDRLSGE